MELLKKCEVISFDLGNTLMQYLGDTAEAHNEFKKLLFAPPIPNELSDIDPELFYNTHQKLDYRIYMEALAKGTDKKYMIDSFQLTFSELDLPIPDEKRTIELCQKYFDARFSPTYLKMYATVPELLQFLKYRGKRIILISNFPERTAPETTHYVQYLLEYYGITKFFEHILVSGELNMAKPSPSIFKYAEKIIGVSGEKIVHIGDDFEADIIGGAKSGWNTVWLSKNPSGLDLSSANTIKPDLICSDITQFKEIVMKTL